MYEKIHTAVVGAIDETTGVKRRLADWALVVGREVGKREEAGLPVGGMLRLKHRAADKLVFHKIRARLGGRLRTPISGGAPLVQEIAEFFDAIGIRIFEGYGLTECTTAATTNTPERWRFGTVGPALPGFELRLADDGELLIRSDTVFGGYYKDPEATAEVLGADGWLRSGDIAEIDEDGFVKITDRKKDIIVTAGGKNIAPQNLENDLKASKFVSQALVVGDRRPYPAALITLDAPEIEKWAAGKGITGDMAALAADDQVIALVQGIVDDVNRERSRFEQIKRFSILPRDFTIEDDEVTPTLKLKRRNVMAHFAETVDQLYDASLSAAARSRARARALEAAGADVAAVVAHARDLDDVAGVRRVDELAAADVDADVAEAGEEDEVAGLQVARTRRAIRSRTGRRRCGATRRRPGRRRSMTSPEQSKALGPAAPQTYGLPSSCIASPTTPPYCDGGAAGIRESEGVESIEAVKLPAASSVAAARAVEAARCCAASRASASLCSCACRRASSACSCLISLWIPASICWRCASWLSIDCFWLRALGHDLGLVLPRRLQALHAAA